MNKLKKNLEDMLMVAVMGTFILSLFLTFISYTPIRYAIICVLSLIVLVKEMKQC